ncbi:MAG: tyrosine-type recombinase/integrase [Acidimicrobiia bacterium]|nr:tyrosine-type recombinase/integrase [Acidimicrobiia bacterium]
MTPLARHASIFVFDYLPRDKGASPHTVEAYSQGLSLLLRFAAGRLKLKQPSQLALEQIDADLVLAFLEDIEQRGASVSTRNARLAAIKAFFRFLEWREPSVLAQAAKIALIPKKKADKSLVVWLTRTEIRALLEAPDPRRWAGTRDRAMLHLTYTCGLRVSELTALALADYDRRTPASVRIMGKGRRERLLPLWKETRLALEAWLRLRDPDGDQQLFHNRSGRGLSRWGFNVILAKHVKAASMVETSLANKRVTPHTLRHSCAMHTLQANSGDVRKVSVWLGHATIKSTEVYLHADPTEKLEILDGVRAPRLRPGRFRAPDKLVAMLSGASKGRRPMD